MAFRKLKSHVTMRTTSVVSDTNLQQNVEDGRNSPKWKPSKQVKLIVATQAFVCFFVALDSTILTTTLPVCHTSALRKTINLLFVDTLESIAYKHHPDFLDCDLIPLDLSSVPTTYSCSIRYLRSSSIVSSGNHFVHHWVDRLLRITRYSQHAHRSFRQRHRRWRYPIAQFDHFERHHSPPSESTIPGLPAALFRSRKQHCACHRRAHR